MFADQYVSTLARVGKQQRKPGEEGKCGRDEGFAQFLADKVAEQAGATDEAENRPTRCGVSTAANGVAAAIAVQSARRRHDDLVLPAGLEFVRVYRGVTAAEPRPDPREIIEGGWWSPADIEHWLAREPARFTGTFKLIFAALRGTEVGA